MPNHQVARFQTIAPTSPVVGAIVWNLATWWFGIPSSSSHALIGGMIGAAVAAIGFSAVEGEGVLSKVLVPALIAPVLAGVVALGATVIVYRLIRNFATDRAERGFRWAQVASSSMVALAHGTNDAQKTMGVISLALIANGNLSGGDNFDVPTGSSSRAARRSRSAPTPAAGGSSRRSAPRSPRCARRRASPRRRSPRR